MYPDPAGSGDADAIRLADELEYYFHGMLTPDGANGRLAAATIRRLAARVESLERELAGRTVPGDVLAAAETVVSVPSTMNAWGAEPGRLIPCAYRMARFILSLNAPPGGPTGQRDPAVAYAEATIRNLQGG
jgi:hypothetical protein